MFGKLSAFKRALLPIAMAVNAPLSLSLQRRPQMDSESDAPIKDHLAIVGASASRKIAQDVAQLLGTKLVDVDMFKAGDGEHQINYKENIRGRSVYIVQSCSTPVYDNVMELLLLTTAARRAGAKSVTAVIPYFAFKYHKRGAPISTKHSSRFLWSAANDFAKMLETAGVDMVISVDLQRPGQGHEACFFDTSIPVETVNSNITMAEFFKKSVPLSSKVVVVAANPNCAKKAIGFRDILSDSSKIKADHAIYLHSTDPQRESEFLGSVEGADAIILDEIVDLEDGSLASLIQRLKKKGAKKIYLCTSHGIFSPQSHSFFDISAIEKIVVSDTISLDSKCSKKIVQVSMAPQIAKVIEAEFFHDSSDELREENVKIAGTKK